MKPSSGISWGCHVKRSSPKRSFARALLLALKSEPRCYLIEDSDRGKGIDMVSLACRVVEIGRNEAILSMRTQGYSSARWRFSKTEDRESRKRGSSVIAIWSSVRIQIKVKTADE